MNARLLALAMLALFTAFTFACGGTDDDGDSDESDDDETNDNDDTSADNLDDDVTDDDAHPSDHGFYQFAPRPSNEIGVFVAKTGDDANPGTMAEPKKTIGAGVALAEAAGKSVFVAVGTYEESVNSKVSLYGGFNNAFTHRETDLLETVIAATGEFGVQFALEESDAPVTLEGFTIRESAAQVQSALAYTAGVYMTGGYAVIAWNTIFGGAGTRSSNGMNVIDGSIVALGNRITGGAAASPIRPWSVTGLIFGGSAADSQAVLIGNVISAEKAGNGEANRSVGLTAFDLASATNDGTRIFAFNNVIRGAEAGASTTVEFWINPHYDTLARSGAVFVNNVLIVSHGGDGFVGTVWGLYWMHNIVWGPEAECLWYFDHWVGFVQYECIETLGEFNRKYDGPKNLQNISADPLFVGPDDFHLTPESPGIDAGMSLAEFESLDMPWPDTPEPPYWLPDGLDLETLLAYDADGDPRPYGAGWDIGPDEWTPQ
ncbi:MAG: DUF1565 domain-containing protein [Deltaproteobacteria bacterium]|nr:DUF1565 domain-containing protein [Deltaproteobacteria bacterium]